MMRQNSTMAGFYLPACPQPSFWQALTYQLLQPLLLHPIDLAGSNPTPPPASPWPARASAFHRTHSVRLKRRRDGITPSRFPAHTGVLAEQRSADSEPNDGSGSHGHQSYASCGSPLVSNVTIGGQNLADGHQWMQYPYAILESRCLPAFTSGLPVADSIRDQECCTTTGKSILRTGDLVAAVWEAGVTTTKRFSCADPGISLSMNSAAPQDASRSDIWPYRNRQYVGGNWLSLHRHELRLGLSDPRPARTLHRR